MITYIGVYTHLWVQTGCQTLDCQLQAKADAYMHCSLRYQSPTMITCFPAYILPDFAYTVHSDNCYFQLFVIVCFPAYWIADLTHTVHSDKGYFQLHTFACFPAYACKEPFAPSEPPAF